MRSPSLAVWKALSGPRALTLAVWQDATSPTSPGASGPMGLWLWDAGRSEGKTGNGELPQQALPSYSSSFASGLRRKGMYSSTPRRERTAAVPTQRGMGRRRNARSRLRAPSSLVALCGAAFVAHLVPGRGNKLFPAMAA